MIGKISLMLHAHMPYCRKSGQWPAGEEWLFEAMNETYLPLLSLFRRFQRNNLKPHIMVGVVPILAEQLADDYMKDRYIEYTEDRISRAEKEIERFQTNEKKKQVAQYWKEFYTHNLYAFNQHFYQDILGTLKWLQEENVIEILTSAATHGLLPLMKYDSSIYSQVQLGMDTYRKYFERDPKGFWLPECAYRPREWSDFHNRERKAIDEWLAEAGIQYFFVENVGIENASFVEQKNAGEPPSVFRGYKLESGVYVFGRNQKTGKQVWSPEYGYPGDPYYREFHKKDSESGLHYWRVSEGGDEKKIYVPMKAQARSQDHAQHFVDLMRKTLQDAHEKYDFSSALPIINSQYDCELFGHWWFEGIDWIEDTYNLLLKKYKDEFDCVSLSEYIGQYGDSFSTIRMQRSSWGENSDFSVWEDEKHAWVWPYINSSTKDFEDVLANIFNNGKDLSDWEIRILRQTGRELLLMEGSDWPFLLHTKQATSYANKRFHNHHQRFNKLIWAAKDLNDYERISDEKLKEMEDIDNPWADLDFGLFKRIE